VILMIKKLIVFALSLMVSIVLVSTIFFIFLGADFGLPEVRQVESNDDAYGFEALEGELYNLLVYTQDERSPAINRDALGIEFLENDCLDVRERSYQFQVQRDVNDIITGFAFYSVKWDCPGSGQVRFLVNDDALESEYHIGIQGSSWPFFRNVFLVIVLSLILSVIIYLITSRLLFEKEQNIDIKSVNNESRGIPPCGN